MTNKQTNRKEFYKCYSSVLYRYLEINNQKPINIGRNPITNRPYSVYLVTDELSELLSAFTQAKIDALGYSRKVEGADSDETL